MRPSCFQNRPLQRDIPMIIRFTTAIFSGLLLVATGYAAEVFIKTAPPRPVSVAVVGKAPSPRHVWIPGYYNGVGGRYVWVPGRWMVPPRAGVVWVAPRWAPRNGGYVFVQGHWR